MRYIAMLVLVALTMLSCSEEKKQSAPVVEQKSDIELLREKIQSNPNDADAQFHLAEFYERANLYQEQVETLKKVVAIRPDMGYAHFKLGTAYNRLGRYQEAVASFTKAAKYEHKQPMIYNNMAFSYGKLG
jgi:tetratricopeptide (TPR) repeat protein